MDSEGEGKLNGLDLFSGIGGISQALAPWVRTIAYCERERYPQAVLLSRMERGEIDVAPIWDDVCTLNAGMLPRIDIISGGFPCQDLSTAGLRKGLAGERSGLFFEIARLTRELRPRFVFMENVAGIFAGDTLGAVGGALASIGYDCRWGVLSAYDVGAPHIRERWFCLAYSTGARNKREPREICETKRGQIGTLCWKLRGASKKSENLAHAPSIRGGENNGAGESNEFNKDGKIQSLAHSTGVYAQRFHNGSRQVEFGRSGWWEVEPAVGRVADGIPMRNDRLKCLGNGVVPQQVQEAFQRLAGLKNPWEVK